MEPLANLFASAAGVPAMAGLILTAVAIFVTADWRLSLTGLLVQYVLAGLALTRFIRGEVAIVKILVGVLVVSILYLSARRIQEVRSSQAVEKGGARFLGLNVAWEAGPLGLPLRWLVVLLVTLAVLRFANDYRLFLPALNAENPTVPFDVAFVAFWLGAMGLVGLILSGDPLRVAPAMLTILTGFDLIYAGLELNLAIVGFWGALSLLAALAFSYLATIQGLGTSLDRQNLPVKSLSEGAPDRAGPEEEDGGE